MSGSAVPTALQEIVEDFAAVGPRDRLQLLLEMGQELPGLPERYQGAHERMEQVSECQSPLFLAVETGSAGPDGHHAADAAGGDAAGGGADVVRLFFDAPAEAPTTRGFAGILHTGLDGQPRDVVLGVPDDFYVALGLADLVSPLRLRGMAAMLARVKGQVRAAAAAG